MPTPNFFDGALQTNPEFGLPIAAASTAIDVVLLTQGSSAADASTYDTAVVNPPAGEFLIVFATSSHATLTSADISCSGLGLTWTEQANLLYGDAANIVRRHKCWTAPVTASPTVGPITFTMSGNTPSTGCEWTVLRASNTSTVVQAVTGVGNATSGTLTLAAAGAVGNRAVSAWAWRAQEDATPRTAWTELSDTAHGSPVGALETQWRTDAFEATATAAWTTTARYGAVALELGLSGPSTSGTATGTWGTWTGAVTGTPTVIGTAARTWSAWVGAASGTPTVVGAAARNWGQWIGAAAGGKLLTGTAVGTWGSWVGSVTGAPTRSGTAAGLWGQWHGAVTGTPTVLGTGARNWCAWVGAVNGGPVKSGVAAGTWGTWTGAVAGTPTVVGTASRSWGAWVGSAAGLPTVVGTASRNWGAWVGTATATKTVHGTASSTWGVWAGATTGLVTVTATTSGLWGGWVGTAVGTIYLDPPDISTGVFLVDWYDPPTVDFADPATVQWRDAHTEEFGADGSTVEWRDPVIQ